MNRLTGGAAALLVLLALGAGRASGADTAVTPTTGTLPDATTVAVNNGPGDQTDPHVAGRYVTYTNEVSGNSEVRFYNLATRIDDAVSNEGQLDFLPDTDGTTIAYTHLGDNSSIWTYSPTTGAQSEVDATPNSNRREGRVGGNTIVWQDFGFTNDITTPEIVVEDTSTGAVTRLTNDQLLDKDPAVSPDGNTVVWTKCQTDSTGCVIWEARRTAGGWSSNALTSPAEDAELPDTDGSYVVYGVNPGGEEDVAWQPVGGGAEHTLTLSGQQTNPNISNGVITYENLDWSTQVPNFDVWLYDIAPNTLYRLTNDPEDETLNDISVNTDRQVTVVWTKSEADDNVYAEYFTLPPLAAADTTPPTVSVDGFADGDSFTVGAPRPAATCSSSDDGSGIATTTGPTEQDNLDANGVGTVSVTCTATDNAGNTASATSTYSIGYALSGFDGLQTTGHAGRAIPVQWQLGAGDGGFVDALSAVSSITYRTASCDSFAPTGQSIVAATAGKSGLRYDPDTNAYVFTWKTPRTSGCYVLSVTLDSGQELQANVTLS